MSTEDQSQNLEDNAGTRQAGTDDSADSVRDLLNAAMAEEPEDKGNIADSEPTPKEPEDKGNIADSEPTLENKQIDLRDVDAVISQLPETNRQAVKDFIVARDAAFNNWAQQTLNRVSGLENINRVMQPRIEAWAVNGLTPEQGLTQLFAISDLATRDPVEFVAWFAGQHNIDLANLLEEVEEVDPELQALRNEVQQLRGNFQQQQNYTTTQQHNSLVQLTQNFAEEKDASGNALRPYFSEVERDIQNFIPIIKANNPNFDPRDILQTAYDQAVWANPSTRSKLQQADAEQRAQQQLKENAERARKAKLAGSSISGESADTANSVDLGNSLRETLAKAFEYHS